MAVEITLDDYKVEIGNIPDSLRLVCDSLAYQIEPELPMNAVSSEWILPNDMKVTSQDLTIDSPGLYQFIVYDEDACGDTTPLHVVLDTIAPSIQLFEDTLDCNRPGISLQYVSDGSEVDISWTGPNGFQSNSSEPLISDGGIYYLELSDRGGCTARDSVFIEEDFQLPAYQLADTFYSNCDDGQAELWVETNVEDVSWYINNQLVSNADSFSTELDGRFRIILEGENGCRAIDSVWVNSNGKTPRAQWHTPVLSCTNLIDTFQLLQAEGQYDYKWTGPNNYSSTNASAVVGQEGMYRVTITDAKGCDTNYTFQLEQISYPIAIDFIVQNMIRCADSVASVNVDLDHGLKDTLVNWQAIQGEILQGASKLKAELKGPGLFVFEVKDTIDGCIASDTLQLREFPKPPLSIIANIQDKLCEEDRGTFIEILPQDSSRAPFQYSIEDMGFTEEYKYLNLLPGNYNIQVRDRQGCLYEEDYEILDLSGEQHLTLGEDRDVNLGEDVIIHPTIDVNEGIIDKAIWVVNGDTVCMQCDSLEVFIDDSKKVEFIIRTKGGCTVYDQLNLLAPIKQEIFVPNIFSPNNDGSNDIFFIQTRLELDQIELVQIFDRWGNRVFEAKNFPPNERIYGWDGTFEGKTLFPQVFAVRLIYVYEGERRIEHYDLMLMR
jgi:gliding motility-associated-like protein